MPRRTKEELKALRDEKRIKELIQKTKYLRDSKYYKNNYWSWAAHDSWAARGKNGSCGCRCGYYNANLCNKRTTTYKNGRENLCKEVSSKLCSNCINKIEKELNYTFKKRY